MIEYRKCCICGDTFTNGEGNVCPGCEASLKREEKPSESVSIEKAEESEVK